MTADKHCQCLANCAIGILDFHPAAGSLWRATATLFDCRSPAAVAWFKRWRTLLCHGDHQTIPDSLTSLISTEVVQANKLDTLMQVQA